MKPWTACRCAPRASEIVAVVGPSGCGKTTLLELICGLQRPDAGNVRCRAGGADAPARPAAAVAERARQRRPRAPRAGRPRAQARAAAAPWLERFGLADSSGHVPPQLSGGMRQRVSFLRTLLAGKPVLALDEPFAALDAITRAEMQGWLSQVLDSRAANGRAGHPRRRGGGRAGRPGGRDVAATGASGRRDRGRAATAAAAVDPAVVALREQRPEALGVRSMRTVVALAARGAAARAARRLGAVRRPRRRRLRHPARRHTPWPARCTTTARCCGATSWSPPRRFCSDILARRRRGAGPRDRDPLLAHAAPRGLSVARRLPDDPDPVLAPILVLWLGFGLLPKLIVIALVSFFSIVVTTLAGLAAVDPELIKLMRTFDASGCARSGTSSCRPRCRGVHGRADRRRGLGDRRRVRRSTGRTRALATCSCSRPLSF